MTTLTIQGDNAIINQILELIQGVKDKITISKDENAPNSFENEAEFKAHIKALKKDFEAYDRGELKNLLSYDEICKRA